MRPASHTTLIEFPPLKLPMSFLRIRRDRTWGGRGESREEAFSMGAGEGLLCCAPPDMGSRVPTPAHSHAGPKDPVSNPDLTLSLPSLKDFP